MDYRQEVSEGENLERHAWMRRRNEVERHVYLTTIMHIHQASQHDSGPTAIESQGSDRENGESNTQNYKFMNKYEYEYLALDMGKCIET